MGGRTRRLARALAKRGHDVTFVEFPSVRAALREHLQFGPRRIEQDGMNIVRLCPLPGFGRVNSPLVDQAWVRLAGKQLRHWIDVLPRSTFIVSTPWWLPVVNHLPRKAMCYDCTDHISVHIGAVPEGRFTAWHETLLNSSDLVTAVSSPLIDHLASRTPRDRLCLLTNGVDPELIANGQNGTAHAAASQTTAGFVGALFNWVNVKLIAETAQRLEDVVFRIIGPRHPGVDMAPLLACPNVRIEDEVDYAEVPAIMRSFDVGLIPFKDEVIARCADPLKLYEYCAAGIPVVSSIRFRPHDVQTPISVGGDSASMASSIAEAVRTDDGPHRSERMAFAARHTWDAKAGEFLEHLDRALTNPVQPPQVA